MELYKQRFNEIKDWYNKLDVQYAMIKYLDNREFAMIAPYWTDMNKISTRNWRVRRTQDLKFLWSYWGMWKQLKPYQMYYSVAKYTAGIPKQDLKNRKESNEIWNENHWKQIETYDFVIDIDSIDHNFEFTLISLKSVMYDLLDHDYICEIRFSGKGFHILINLH